MIPIAVDNCSFLNKRWAMISISCCRGKQASGNYLVEVTVREADKPLGVVVHRRVVLHFFVWGQFVAVFKKKVQKNGYHPCYRAVW